MFENVGNCGFSAGKFGQALYKTPIQAGVYTPASNLLDFATGDFTLEFWVKLTSFTNQYACIVGSGATAWTGASMELFVPNEPDQGAFYPSRHFVLASNSFTVADGGKKGPSGGYLLNSINEAQLFHWHHVAVTRQGNTVRLFVDGVLNDTNTTTAPISFASNGTWIGSNGWDGGLSYFDGAIEEFRVTKGTARYTADFTPQTAPFSF